MLEIIKLTLGPAATNCYILADPSTRQTAVIDPAWDGPKILAEALKRDWHIDQIWITHAHFDHIGGAGELAGGLESPPLIALHPDDRQLWDAQGGAGLFGYSLPANPAITLGLAQGMRLHLGDASFEVARTPGHTPGHCIFYCAEEDLCFCGDLIFHDSVGRTDLPGGDWNTLVKSIREQVYSLPDQTRLLAGHGPETTVGREKRENPFVRLSGK